MTKDFSDNDDTVINDGVCPNDQPALRNLSRRIVQQAAKVTVQEAKAQGDHVENQQDTDLETWNPEQVYQKAIKWVGDEIQEHLLDGFLDSSNDTGDMLDTHKFIEYLIARGLSPISDIRLKTFMDAICLKSNGRHSYSNVRQFIPKDEFKSLVLANSLLLGAIKGDLVVDDFHELSAEIDAIFDTCSSETGGEMTTYIPSLGHYSPDKWAAAICTTDGQMHSCGDISDLITLQSVTKPIFYAMCLDEVGNKAVHAKVGKESSGHGFNKITLSRNNIPHNPVINTGAITLASLYKTHLPMSIRFQSAMSKYKALAAGSFVSFNNTVYLSERDNGHRNYAIGHYLKSKGCLDENVNLTDTLELYFQMCSIEAPIEAISIMAASLANGGRNVFTGEQVVTERSVQNMLSIMYSCGMYDYSGEWAFEIGLPAKSGVSGLIIIIIPDIMGIALWSPNLDTYGNSVRGVKFAEELVSRYSTEKQQNLLHPFSNKRYKMTETDTEYNRGHSVHGKYVLPPLRARPHTDARFMSTSSRVCWGLSRALRFVKR